jgi:hypothetical protein
MLDLQTVACCAEMAPSLTVHWAMLLSPFVGAKSRLTSLAFPSTHTSEAAEASPATVLISNTPKQRRVAFLGATAWRDAALPAMPHGEALSRLMCV